MQIDFTCLWKDLPPHTDTRWRAKHPKQKRELLHLLCGALWHLELAAEITGKNFSDAPMGDALDAPANKPIVPWEPWTSLAPNPPKVEVDTGMDEHKLSMSYTYHTPISVPKRMHLQTLFLGDGALRLAGVYEYLNPKPAALSGDDCFTDLLDEHGYFNPSIDTSTPLIDARVRLLLVIAFRDSFMHGERRDGENRRWKFRTNWFDGRFTQTHNLPYSPAIIAQACRKVWEELRSSL
jgi:hypothetical protein